ncbi:hypothetical protein NEPTK9_000400 [Candidatus Neptunochlamydia vexilliferae]|uniref:G domain-containing protein n=1 Tax=Candidatus Neptunichlamydia vexilliferae TaxID=1651774 RepID=A0ABS0AZY9_9BACT|nr:hypothetical protein [Candidatus Neptunochlamydia vexilliferae]
MNKNKQTTPINPIPSSSNYASSSNNTSPSTNFINTNTSHSSTTTHSIPDLNATLKTLNTKDPKTLLAQKLKNPHQTLTHDESIALLLECVRQGQAQAQKAQDKEITLFIGNTGAGKSTTVNYLCGCTFELKRWKDLGIKGLGKAIVVKPTTTGGAKNEVMPIGHTKISKTFMPQIEKEGPNTYMDCPGFLDNRGVEINIANAVNIKNAVKAAKTAKVVILINYHALQASRGRGVSEMLQIAYNLFGNKQNLLKSKNSLLIGITKAPTDSSLEELRDFITEDNPVLEALQDQIFTYDPLDRPLEDAWKKEDFLNAISNLKPVPHHKKIFSTVLTYEDEHKLLQISQTLGQRIQQALQTKNYPQAALHYQHLASLSVIDHHTIERHLQTQKRKIHTHAATQTQHFYQQAFFQNFTQAENHLTHLKKLLQAFPALTPHIKPQELAATLNHSKKQKAEKEARERAYQKQIQAVNQKLEDSIKQIDAQKARMEQELTQRDKKYQELLTLQKQTHAQSFQTLENTFQKLIQERDARLEKQQQQYEAARQLNDQKKVQQLQQEKQKIEATYQKQLEQAEQEKQQALLQNQKLLETQKKTHTAQQQALQNQIKQLEAQKIQKQTLKKQILPSIAYGKATWEKHFGPGSITEKEPPLPPNIEQILNEPTPFKVEGYSGKVRDTHLLVWIPSKVNNTPLTLDNLEGLFGKYKQYASYVKSEVGSKGTTSHWILMSKNVLEGTRNKTYDNQEQIVGKYAYKGYTLPNALDVAVAVLLHQKEKKEYLLPEKPQWTFTRCQEKVNNNQSSVAIGGFAGAGLRVSSVGYYCIDDGAVGVRKLRV